MGNLIDLVGMKFNNLTVISRAENGNKYKSRWNCLCDCGSSTIVDGWNLRNGHVKSCGCLIKTSNSKANTKDMTGKRFHMLSVLSRAGSDKYGKAIWLCKCDCGNVVKFTGDSLRTGTHKSCGCEKKERKPSPKKKYNEIDVDGSIAYVKTRNGDIVIIDSADVILVKNIYWDVNKNGYAYGRIGGKFCTMHRFIMKPNESEVIDHINHNKLDNRRSNLRVCTQSQNCMNGLKRKNNKSGVVGVCKAPGGKWRASINVRYKHIHLGQFSNKSDAIKARKEAEKKYFGEFAVKE